MNWFSILKKYNLQLMKEAMRRVVVELDGESIETKTLTKKLTEKYREVVKELGTPSEKAGLGKLKNPKSVSQYHKLIRNYGYDSRQVKGTIGRASLNEFSRPSNPILDTTIWEKK